MIKLSILKDKVCLCPGLICCFDSVIVEEVKQIEESKGNSQPQGRASGRKKNKAPPNLKQVAVMLPEDVFKWLSKWPRSVYHGMAPQEIANTVNYNKAIRYLNDLVLQSDLESSDFDVIFEQNSSVEGSSKYLGSEDRSFANPISLFLHINSKSKGNSKLSTESLPISMFSSKENEQKRSSSCYNFVPKSSFDNF